MSKIIFITGVSSGFGKQTAEFLASKGYKVYGTVRKETSIDSSVNLVSMDVTNAESIQNAVNQVINKEGRIDILINNAGMGISGSIEDTTVEEAKLQMDTNFYGVFMVIKAVLPVMRKQFSGTIINISSIGGLMGLPFQALYSSSKFAVEGLSEGLRMELKPYNIKVVLVNPGDFYTNFTANRRFVSGNSGVYSHQYKKTMEVIEKDEKAGLLPIVLAKKIYTILEMKNPSASYIVATLEQKLAIVLKYMLPGLWFSKILQDHYKIK